MCFVAISRPPVATRIYHIANRIPRDCIGLASLRDGVLWCFGVVERHVLNAPPLAFWAGLSDSVRKTHHGRGICRKTKGPEGDHRVQRSNGDTRRRRRRTAATSYAPTLQTCHSLRRNAPCDRPIALTRRIFLSHGEYFTLRLSLTSDDGHAKEVQYGQRKPCQRINRDADQDGP